MLIILSLMPVIPQALQSNQLPAHQRQASPPVIGPDPKGTLVAFNSTRAQFDIYTGQSPGVITSPNNGTGTSPGVPPPGTLTWFGGNFTNIPETGFNYAIPSAANVNQTIS